MATLMGASTRSLTLLPLVLWLLGCVTVSARPEGARAVLPATSGLEAAAAHPSPLAPLPASTSTDGRASKSNSRTEQVRASPSTDLVSSGAVSLDRHGVC